ncbi:MAG: hypothetical protein JSU00_11680 [Acidobacteria bacterium]|nr:hypothetical protein [Acidobacteriota bacterium]
MKSSWLLFLCIAVAIPGKDREWKSGKVVDASQRSSSQAEAVTGSAQQVGPTTQIDTARVHYSHAKANDIIIVGDGYVFNVEDATTTGGVPAVAIGRAIANKHHGCRFIVGDEIKYAQEKGTMYVIDVDGKQCRTAILRQERLQQQSRRP